ncbi:hypothetical protein ABW286_12475 [Erwinia papayae]|uniref:ABC transmembrane type-1 domain-containing protein n=1 Tax=Erwinia papayae TaxID=206499 RepID=A0ABV3N2E8_9GAMM
MFFYLMHFNDFLKNVLIKMTGRYAKFFIAFFAFLYLTTITASSFFYYKIIDPKIWHSTDLFISLSVYILLYYFLYNISFILANVASSLSQALYFSKIKKENLLRATLERDIKSVGELHNIFLNYYVTLSILLITCYRLVKISIALLAVYAVVIGLIMLVLKVWQKKIKHLDKKRKAVIDRFIQASKKSHWSSASVIRAYENKIVWKLQKYMTVSRVIYNLAPLMALIIALTAAYLHFFTLSLSQTASLVIISTVLIDIADSTSYLVFYSSQITNGLERIKKFSLTESQEVYNQFSFLNKDMLRCFIKTSHNFKQHWLKRYVRYFVHGKSSSKTVILLLLSFFFLTAYSFLKFKFDVFVVSGVNLITLLSVIIFSLFCLMLADLLLKRLFYINAKFTIFALLHKLSQRKVNDKDIEVLSYDTKVLDDGISFSLTEFFFALATSLIFIYSYVKMGSSLYILAIVIVLFSIGQYVYRKLAVFTKQMEVYFVTRSGTLLSGEIKNYPYAVQVYFSSLSSQLANTINNRIFMVYCALLISAVIFSLSQFTVTSSFPLIVATVSLLFKLSHSLSYAIRYLSQLEGWSISVARTLSRIY